MPSGNTKETYYEAMAQTGMCSRAILRFYGPDGDLGLLGSHMQYDYVLVLLISISFCAWFYSRSANHWLDVLYSQGADLEDDELVELIRYEAIYDM